VDDIHWGRYSVTLFIGSLQGIGIAIVLFGATRNRAANRALALLIAAVVLRITPYTLGFAGYFAHYQWLNFAPFYWDLAFGPLIWLYVRQLGRQSQPSGWAWHFLPVALQVGYYVAVCVLVPPSLRDAYNDHYHAPWILPLLVTARCVSYGAYAIATARAFATYQSWLTNHSGLREEFRLNWLRWILSMAALVLICDGSLSLFEVWVSGIAYSQEFPLYVIFAVLIWVLGLEGWRQAERAYPKMDAQPETALLIRPAEGAPIVPYSPAPARIADWAPQGQRWLAEIEAQAWWRDPEVSLAVIAQRLGTNTAYLSRALNEGVGLSFSDAINGLRVAAAKHRLAGPGPILDIALEVGFASKASFNRVFKAMTGTTPSQFRQDTSPGRLTK
jgi:AraC-like DNA-binding protein